MEYHLKYRVRARYALREKDRKFNDREIVFSAENDTVAIPIAEQRWKVLKKAHEHGADLEFDELVTETHSVPWMPI